MREYRGSEIRNIAVVGHGASGKTSLVEALAFVSGSSKRHGSIADGTTLTDSAPEEVERGYSINLGCAFAEWMDTKINLIDTPGFLDFHGDTKEQILELYLNEIYLGAGAYGVAAAAQTYWDKSLNELSVADCAYLATLPKAPSNYNPFRFPERAIERRNWVIDRMVENGFVRADGDRGTAHGARASGCGRQAPVKLETPNSRHYLMRDKAFTTTYDPGSDLRAQAHKRG